MRTLLFLSLTAQAVAQPNGRVPASLLDWAHADPMTMTQLLVEAGLAAGLEVTAQDYRRFQVSRPLWWNPDTLNREHFERQPTVEAEALIAAFNAARNDYAAEVQEDAIVIRPTGARAGYLDSRALAGRLTAVGLMRMGEKVFAPLDPRLDQPGGRVGSRLGRIGVEIDFGDALDITVDTRFRTVQQVLNAIVRRASARAWIVITTTDASTSDLSTTIREFGFMHRWGTATYMTIAP